MQRLHRGEIRMGCPARYGFILLAAAVLCQGSAVAEEPSTPGVEPSRGPSYRWFSVPLEVSNLPRHCESIPVSCPIDLSGLLDQLQVDGAIDERSLRLLETGDGGKEVQVSVQFLAAPLSKPSQRKRLSDTPPSVSYAAEYPAGETPTSKSIGELFWMARTIDGGIAHYRLQFGVLERGRMIQVPYPPQNLRAFDPQGRATPTREFPAMQIRPQRPLAGVVQLLADNHVVLGYHVGPDLREKLGLGSIRRPFFYPVVGPDDVSLTEFGKPHDPTDSHAHHYSLWVAHADVAAANFWSEAGGSIHSEQLALLEDGPVFCRVLQRNRWVHQDKPLLLERRQTTLYHTPEAFRLFDLELEFSAPEKEAVKLGKTSFGFLAARVAQSMSVFDGGGEIVNAQGDCNEQGVHLKRARWLDQSGPIATGKWNGLAMFDHPSNPHHPTVWHCRNDGWAGASFNGEQPFVIEPGQPLRLRYRVHLHRGNAETGQVARFYDMFAAQPTIAIGKPSADR